MRSRASVLSFMIMTVVKVQSVRVRMGERLVDVPVGMWLARIYSWLVGMLMVFIMGMTVAVLDPFMPVRMLVLLGEVEPHAMTQLKATDHQSAKPHAHSND